MAEPAVPFDISESDVRAGMPITSVSALAATLDLPVVTLLDWLTISPRTWARRKQAGVLDTLESDRVARLSRLLRRATTVVGGRQEACDWLLTPNRALQRRRPFDVARTEIGADAVFALLGRIEHGVFS
jgi:putative toxin-antitoxin system antitoxin component (TIGR02293 family)